MNAIQEGRANIGTMRQSFAPEFGNPDNLTLSDCSTKLDLDQK